MVDGMTEKSTSKRNLRLTDRQLAVAASVERLGSANCFDLMREFPSLTQSVLMRVADRLVELGRLRVEGDPTRRYIGDVRYFPAAAESMLPAELKELEGFVTKSLRLECFRSGERLGIVMPMDEVERHILGLSWSALDYVLGGSHGSIHLLQEHLREKGLTARLALEVQRMFNQGRTVALMFGLR
jgi:hypothetical protein